MELAVVTGIPPSVWAEEGEEIIVTALDIRRRSHRRGADGEQLSG